MSTKNRKTATPVVTSTQQDPETLKLAQAEATAIAKHGDKVVEGSAQRDSNSNKVTVLIRTKGIDGEFDGNTRRVATSDVHQVHHMPEIKKALDRAKARESRPSKIAKLEAVLASKGLSMDELLADN